MGTWIMLQDGACLNVSGQGGKIEIEDFGIVGRNTEIESVCSVRIARNCLFAPNVFITDDDHSTRMGEYIRGQSPAQGSVEIGDDAWIGAGAAILSGATIGDGAV